MVSSRLDTAGFLARSSSGDPEPRREYALTPAGDGRRDCRAKRGARAQQRGAILVVEPQLPASETSRCAQRWWTVATIVPVLGAAAAANLPVKASTGVACRAAEAGIGQILPNLAPFHGARQPPGAERRALHQGQRTMTPAARFARALAPGIHTGVKNGTRGGWYAPQFSRASAPTR
jgi:hypothetical protein